jgi:hypothetical protein
MARSAGIAQKAKGESLRKILADGYLLMNSKEEMTGWLN